MPYLEELTLRKNHSFVYRRSHFENRHDEHKECGKWSVAGDSLVLEFRSNGSANRRVFKISGDTLCGTGSSCFVKKVNIGSPGHLS